MTRRRGEMSDGSIWGPVMSGSIHDLDGSASAVDDMMAEIESLLALERGEKS